jgi:glycerol-3-phosphate dehydrogenase
LNRSQQIQQLQLTHHWDIIIIGGGATGLGAAVDAAARGYKTLLVEQYDFGKGTSSRSTKLIHGGVRYLQQGNIRLVRDALKERGLLLKNAPHLAHPLKLVMPSYRWYETLYYGLGLKVYNFLSGKLSLGKSEMLSIKRTQQYIKGLDGKRLSGGVAYYDGQFDDARLCTTLALTAVDVSATVLNYAKVTSLIRENEKVKGVVIYDVLNDETYEARGTVVVNATGVFVDEVLRMDDDGLEKAVSPSQGIHIVVDKQFFPGESRLCLFHEQMMDVFYLPFLFIAK